MAVLSVLWFVAVLLLYRTCGWLRFRTPWLLLPSVLLMAMMLVGSLVAQLPKNPQRYFKRYAGTDLPANVAQLRWEHTQYAFDSVARFTFATTPDEVDRMVADMNLNGEGLERFEMPLREEPWIGGFDDFPEGWQQGYEYRGRRGSSYLQLITNKAKTRVYVEGGDS